MRGALSAGKVETPDSRLGASERHLALDLDGITRPISRPGFCTPVSGTRRGRSLASGVLRANSGAAGAPPQESRTQGGSLGTAARLSCRVFRGAGHAISEGTRHVVAWRMVTAWRTGVNTPDEPEELSLRKLT